MNIWDFIQQLKLTKQAEQQLYEAYYNRDREIALKHEAKAEAYDYVIFELTHSVMWNNDEINEILNDLEGE